MKTPQLIRSLAAVVVLSAPLRAQDTVDLKSIQQDFTVMQNALTLRSEIATAVGSGELKTAAAMARLRAASAPSGLEIDAEADFALAAIDIGQRLISAEQPANAEDFFRAAEEALDQVVRKTADTRAQDKALYLYKLAYIRGRYLKKVAEAKTDIEQAIALQPEDKGLQRAQEDLAKENAEHFKDKPKG